MRIVKSIDCSVGDIVKIDDMLLVALSSGQSAYHKTWARLETVIGGTCHVCGSVLTKSILPRPRRYYCAVCVKDRPKRPTVASAVVALWAFVVGVAVGVAAGASSVPLVQGSSSYERDVVEAPGKAAEASLRTSQPIDGNGEPLDGPDSDRRPG